VKPVSLGQRIEDRLSSANLRIGLRPLKKQNEGMSLFALSEIRQW
jgi:hypothetical protein